MKIFNSVSDLVAASLTAGQLTSTKGYTTAGDGGGATYLIKTAVDYAGTPDEYGDHSLANGNVAVLQTEGSVNARQFGAVGDGVTDDTAAIQAAIDATGSEFLYFPSGTYIVSSTLTVTCSTRFDKNAILKPSGIAANAVVFDITARTVHYGVIVAGSPGTDPANGTIGIQVKGTGISASRTQLFDCVSNYCAYGIVVATFSVGLNQCVATGNTCNLSMYGPTTNQEINDINVIGGNYSGNVGTYAVKIGDPDFSTAIPAGTAHGVRILLQGFAVDLGTIKLDSISNVVIDQVYFEAPSGDYCIELGTASQDGYVSLVDVRSCHFRTANFAVYCNAAVRDLNVEPCTYSAIQYSALYCVSDIYRRSYKPGYQAGSFGLGQEFHYGTRALSAVNFSTLKDEVNGINWGVQVANPNVGRLITGGVRIGNYNIRYAHAGSSTLEMAYDSPATGISGSLSGTIFTFTTASDSASFNSGDALTFSLGGSAKVRNVDYVAGTMTIMITSGTSNGAQTVSQSSTYLISTATGTAAPTTGSWIRGSRVENALASVGSPKAWVCTVSGTPGTWVSEGNL